MFDSVKRLYEKFGNKIIVKNAVLKRWLTAEEYRLITDDEYTE